MDQLGLKSIVVGVCASTLSIFLYGCEVFQSPTKESVHENGNWTTAAAYTDSKVRIITQRKHPVLKNDVVCVEPNPDVAQALSTAFGLNATAPSGVSAGTNAGSSEAVAELAGRSTALLGLRDGLYRACEAYANGVLGQDAYALVQSRYSQLMTTLFLGQDLTGAAGAERGSTFSSAMLDALANTKSSGTTNTTTITPSADTKSKNATQAAGAGAAGSTAGAGAATSGSTESQSSGSDASKTSSGTNSSAAATAAGLTGVTALTIGRINEDFLQPSYLEVLLVSCINEYDPTRLKITVTDSSTQISQPTNTIQTMGSNQLTTTAQATSTGAAAVASNSFLQEQCNALNFATLTTLANAEEKQLLPYLIRPDIQPKPTTASDGADQPKVSVAVVLLQRALQIQTECPNAMVKTVDGLWGAATEDAVKAYQICKKITVNGKQDDPATLKLLKIPETSAHTAPSRPQAG